MYDLFISFKDAFINKFGRVLGYPLMIICLITTVSIIIFLFRFLFKFAVGFLITCLIAYGIINIITRCRKRI